MEVTPLVAGSDRLARGDLGSGGHGRAEAGTEQEGAAALFIFVTQQRPPGGREEEE